MTYRVTPYERPVMVLTGEQCADCGAFFDLPHGEAVLCAACWDRATATTRSSFRPACQVPLSVALEHAD